MSLTRATNGKYRLWHLLDVHAQAEYSALKVDQALETSHPWLPKALQDYLDLAYEEFRSVEHVKSWTRDDEEWVRSSEGWLTEQLAAVRDMASVKGAEAYIVLRDYQTTLSRYAPVTRQMLDGESCLLLLIVPV